MEGWVGLGGWLHTEINVRHWELNRTRSPIQVLTRPEQPDVGYFVDRDQRATATPGHHQVIPALPWWAQNHAATSFLRNTISVCSFLENRQGPKPINDIIHGFFCIIFLSDYLNHSVIAISRLVDFKSRIHQKPLNFCRPDSARIRCTKELTADLGTGNGHKENKERQRGKSNAKEERWKERKGQRTIPVLLFPHFQPCTCYCYTWGIWWACRRVTYSDGFVLSVVYKYSCLRTSFTITMSKTWDYPR